MVNTYDILPEKKKLLEMYKSYFDKLSIGSFTTTNVLKEHFQAIHVYLRILAYFTSVDPSKIEVDLLAVEDVYYELNKSVYLLDTKYYD
jgi:hypothetical protein